VIKQFYFRDRLGRGAPTRGKRVAHCQRNAAQFGIAQPNTRDRLRADIPVQTVAHTIRRVKHCLCIRHPAAIAVAEAQVRDRVVIDLDDKCLVIATALQQVAARLPCCPVRIGGELQPWQRLSRVLRDDLARGRVVFFQRFEKCQRCFLQICTELCWRERRF
jgi:hypothetical protein